MAECIQLPDFIREKFLIHFYHDRKYIHIVLPVDNQQIMRNDFSNSKECCFHLSRKYIDAADDFHIVCTSFELGNSRCCTSAFACLMADACKVFRPVTD